VVTGLPTEFKWAGWLRTHRAGKKCVSAPDDTDPPGDVPAARKLFGEMAAGR